MYPYIVTVKLGGCFVIRMAGFANNGLDACNKAEDKVNPQHKAIMYHFEAKQTQLSTMILEKMSRAEVL